MKKLITSLFIALIAITSCSKDEAPTEVLRTNSNLLTKIESTTTTSGSTNVQSFLNTLKYDGNKLKEILSSNGDAPSIYTYTGDLITKAKSNDGPNYTNTSEYFYDSSNKLIREMQVSNETNNLGEVTVRKKKIIYTYNLDGTILEESFKIDNITGIETNDNRKTIYTYSNSNMVKSVQTSITILTNIDNNGNPLITEYKSVSTDTYDYDNKKNFITNILGFNRTSISEISSLNNVIKETSKFESFTDNVLNPNSGVPTVREYVFKYNENDYPIERTFIYTTSINNVISVKTAVSKYIYE